MPNIKTVIRLAAHDKEFAADLIANPAKYKDAFGLTDKHIADLKSLGGAKNLDLHALMSKADYSS